MGRAPLYGSADSLDDETVVRRSLAKAQDPNPQTRLRREVAEAQTLPISREDPHPGAGLRRAIDPIDRPREDPGMTATNRAISCRFQYDIDHRRHSKPPMSLRQLTRAQTTRSTRTVR